MNRILNFFKPKHVKYYRRNYYDGYVVKDFVGFSSAIFKNEKYCYNVSNEIQFGDIQFGKNITSVISTLGNPRYKLVKHFCTFDLTVLIYKDKINNNKKVTVLYFIDDVFVAGEHKFTDLSRENINFLKRMLFKKYDSEREVNQTEFFLKNEGNGCIYYNESFYISVFYLSLSEDTLNKLNSEISERDLYHKNKLSKKENDLLKSL